MKEPTEPASRDGNGAGVPAGADETTGALGAVRADIQATFAATLVDEWAQCGLTDAVVCPGSRSTPLALALVDHDRVRVHVHHDERSGSFLALGLAAVTGRPVVVVTTSGTAAVQLHAAVVEADLAGVPLLVCTADRPPELQGVAAPQTVDQTHLFGRSLRWFADPGVADPQMAGMWRSLAARSWAEASAAWPGPVHLNLAFREPLVGRPQPLPPRRPTGAWVGRRTVDRGQPVLDNDLAGARGIVVAGRGTTEPEAVRALAEGLGWPILADPASGVTGPNRIDLFDAIVRSGFADHHRPQVVIRSGGMPASKALGQWLDAARPVEVTVAPEAWWPDPAHRTVLFLDAVPLAPDAVQPTPDWLDDWTTASTAASHAVDKVLAHQPLSEPAIARTLTTVVPPGGILVTSSSMPVRDVEWFGVTRSDVLFRSNRGANGIDGVVSTAVGAALTGAKTYLLIGDVAFLHDSNGLLGAADRGIDLTVVVVDNGGGGIFSFLPQRNELPPPDFELLFGTPHGLDLVALAQAYGIDAGSMTDSADLAYSPGVRVLVVPGDRDWNVGIHNECNAAVAGVLSSAP